MIRNIFVQLIRFLLISLFCYTTFHKVIDLAKFESTLMKSTLISDSLVVILLYLVPILEVSIIILLLVKNYLIGFYGAFFTLLLFTMYLIALNNFSFYKGCSCGGIFNEISYTQHLVVNIIFLLLSLVGIFLFPNKEKN